MNELSWSTNPSEYAKLCLTGLPFVKAVYYRKSQKDGDITWYIDHDGNDYIIAAILFNTKVLGVLLKGDTSWDIEMHGSSWKICWVKLN